MKYNFLKKTSISVIAMAMLIPSVTWNTKAQSRVDNLLSKMTLRQKITQMMMVDFRYWDEDITDNVDKKEFTVMNPQVQKVVEDYDFGSIIYFAQNIKETEQSLKLSTDLQKAATKDQGIPLLISADQEGGTVFRLGSGTALPGNMALGATGDTKNAELAGEIIGSELQAVGINTDLAPVVDVNNNANNPVIGLRSYSDDAETVGKMASATIKGLSKYNVIGCAKHFPGHGDTATDSHYGLPKVDKTKQELMNNELKPYKVAIDQGIEMIMSAHILYPQLDNHKVMSDKTGKEENVPATLSKPILTDLLKGEMGFDGVICTDAMNMKGISDTFDQVQAVKLAINAGVDIICMPTVLYNLEDVKNLDKIIVGVEKAVESGEIKESRLNDACHRILTLKEKKGILDWKESDYSIEKANAVVGGERNRNLEREIAAKAVTVVKNEKNVLPLHITDQSKVLMLCPYDNEKAQMIMGWNRAKKAGLIPEHAKVDVVRFSDKSTIESLKEKLDWADTYIINSEISKADRMLYKHWLSSKVNDLSTYAKENKKTSIVMSVDKPYDVQLYDQADAILAVYGCKGSSVDVTEALTGGTTTSKEAYGPNIIAGVEVALGVYGASGKLPVNIPKIDPNTLTYTNEVLFNRGYGLTYESLLIDTTVLEQKIDEYSKLDATKYTPNSWKVLSARLKEAQALLQKENVKQSEINQMITSLEKDYKALVKVADTNKANELIHKYEMIKNKDYTETSWKNFVNALNKVKALVNDKNTTQEELDQAIVTLEKAYQELETKKASQQEITNPSVNTGATTNTGSVVAILVISGIAIAALLISKKKKNK